MPEANHDLITAIEQAVWSRSGKRENAEVRFLCPAHPDTNPSARWHPEKHVWICDACSASGGYLDLAKHLDVPILGTPRTKKNGNPWRAKDKGRIVKTYDYTNEHGALLFQVVRFDPKEFRQRAPQEHGWTWSLKGVRRVLYHLPSVLKAIREKRFIILTEGEKDADNLAELGFATTTSPMGAGKWQASYTSALDGAHVVILPDRDDVGDKHAKEVATALTGKAKSIRIVELPLGAAKGIKDASDWLAAGGTAQNLKALIQAAPEWKPEELPEAERLKQELEHLKQENRRLKGNLLLEEDANREEMLKTISEQLGLTVTAVYKYEQETSTYEMTVNDKRVFLGGIGQLLEQKQFELRIADSCAALPRRLSSEMWRNVSALMLKAQEVRIVDETSSLETLHRWIGSYLSQHPPGDPSASWENAAIVDRPFVKDGTTFISLMGLRSYLKRRHGETVTVKEIAELMTRHHLGSIRLFGLTQGTPAKAFRRRFWIIPTEMLDFSPPEIDQETVTF